MTSTSDQRISDCKTGQTLSLPGATTSEGNKSLYLPQICSEVSAGVLFYKHSHTETTG